VGQKFKRVARRNESKRRDGKNHREGVINPPNADGTQSDRTNTVPGRKADVGVQGGIEGGCSQCSQAINRFFGETGQQIPICMNGQKRDDHSLKPPSQKQNQRYPNSGGQTEETPRGSAVERNPRSVKRHRHRKENESASLALRWMVHRQGGGNCRGWGEVGGHSNKKYRKGGFTDDLQKTTEASKGTKRRVDKPGKRAISTGIGGVKNMRAATCGNYLR